jgi:hypothetical protein
VCIGENNNAAAAQGSTLQSGSVPTFWEPEQKLIQRSLSFLSI